MSDSAASGTARVGPRSRDYSWQAALIRQRPETEIPREIQIAWGSAVMAAVMDSRNSGSAHGDASASPNDRLP